MKKLLGIVFLLIIGNSLFAQISTEQYNFVPWDIAVDLPVDSVFAITFEKQKLDSIPVELKRYKNLKALEFRKNNLSQLPSWFHTLDSLEYVGLAKNKFVALPVEICKLDSLHYLDISRNNLGSLSPCISYISNLKALDIWDCEVTSFPENFEKLAKTLVYFDARGMTYGTHFVNKWEAIFSNTRVEFDAPCKCLD